MIATAIHDYFHIEVPVIVKSAAEFAAIVQENPFASLAPEVACTVANFAG